MTTLEVRVPDIGDFADVPIVEVLVSPGDTVAADDPLVVLESDKASMEIPAPQAGRVVELHVKVGDTVSEGSPLAVLEVEGAVAPDGATAPSGDGAQAAGPGEAESRPEPASSGREAPAAPARGEAPAPAPAAEEEIPRGDIHAEVLVLGSGPGGYAAAFRAADLGLKVVLVERHERLGGVCLNVGCIPSKALLHIARVIAETEHLASAGVRFGSLEVDLEALRAHMDGVVGRLTGGLEQMAKGRKVEVVRGEGRFTGPHMLSVETPDGERTVSFEQAIIAAGSRPVELPGIPHDDPRVMDSTDALKLEDIPKRLLVIGGGIIGLELATVYDALGSGVTVVELADGLMPGTDRDLVKPLADRIGRRYEAVHTGTKVEAIAARDDGLHAKLSGEAGEGVFDRVLVAVGRVPNGDRLGLEAAGVRVDERGFIPVDEALRTNVPHIFAIGDIVAGPMLAHKASHQGHVAAEVAAGEDVIFDARAVPSVAYTDPEIAWAGLTETEAERQGVRFEKSVFPWSASGRALAVDGAAGMTKLLHDPESGRLLGAGIVGPNAGELIAELCLAIEMGANVEDIALTVHPHPTLSETVGLAAQVANGTVTDLPNRAARRSGR